MFAIWSLQLGLVQSTKTFAQYYQVVLYLSDRTVCFVKHNNLNKEFCSLSFLLLACRGTECCHSLLGESIRLKENVDHVVSMSSICAKNGKGFLIFSDNARVSNEVLLSRSNVVT